MKRLLLILGVLFTVLCFVGGGYVIYMHGEVSPSYAIVPMLIGMCCLQGYRHLKGKEKND